VNNAGHTHDTTSTIRHSLCPLLSRSAARSSRTPIRPRAPRWDAGARHSPPAIRRSPAPGQVTGVPITRCPSLPTTQPKPVPGCARGDSAPPPALAERDECVCTTAFRTDKRDDAAVAHHGSVTVRLFIMARKKADLSRPWKDHTEQASPESRAKTRAKPLRAHNNHRRAIDYRRWNV